jgi:hypothetical protein
VWNTDPSSKELLTSHGKVVLFLADVSVNFFFQYWGLNSVPTPLATSSALFGDGFFSFETGSKYNYFKTTWTHSIFVFQHFVFQKVFSPGLVRTESSSYLSKHALNK